MDHKCKHCGKTGLPWNWPTPDICTDCKTIPCRNCHRVSVLSKSRKTYVCTICGKREAA